MDFYSEINYNLYLTLEETSSENDIKIRQNAEEKIKKLAQENLGNLLIDLSNIMSDKELKNEIRQISFKIFQKILMLPRFYENYLYLSSGIKNKIKERLFKGFDSEEQNIRISAALAIYAICKIELPRNEFLFVFDIFTDNFLKKSINVQMTSIIAINFILKDVKNDDIIISNENLNKIINIYDKVLNRNNEREENIELALDVLKSIKLNLSIVIKAISESNKIFYFYNLLIKQLNLKSIEIRNLVLSLFIDLTKDYYESFEYFNDILFDYTYNIVEYDTTENKIMCMKIWSSLGLSEQNFLSNNTQNKNCFYFLQKYCKYFTEICLKYIVTTEYENMDSDNDIDNDNFIYCDKKSMGIDTLSDCCYFLIKLMRQNCDYDFVEKMIKYFNMYHESKDINFRYSAFNIFKAILETKHKKKLFPVICKNLDYIYNLINNSQVPSVLQKLCAKYLRSFSFFFINEIIEDEKIFDQLMNYFIILIKVSPKVIIYISLGSINNLCKGIKCCTDDINNNKLSNYIKSLLEPLLSFGANIFLYDNKINIPMTSFRCLSTIAERTASNCRVPMINTFRIIIEMFHSTLRKKKFKDEKIRLIFQEKIALCLSSFFKSRSVDKKGIELLFQYILKSVRQRNSFFEEGLKLLGDMALFIKSDFIQYFPQFKEYLIQGLKCYKKSNLCKECLLCLGNIIQALDKNFNDYIDEYIPIIINIIADNNFELYLKLECLKIISYIFIFCPKEALKSFDIVMQIIGSGIQALHFKLNCEIDKETQIYFNKLRDCLLDTLSCIFCVIQEIGKTNEFLPFVKPLLNFINFICDDIQVISTHVMKSCVKLIINFCKCYGKEIRNMINFNLVKILLNKLEENREFINNPENEKFVDWAKKLMNKTLTD